MLVFEIVGPRECNLSPGVPLPNIYWNRCDFAERLQTVHTNVLVGGARTVHADAAFYATDDTETLLCKARLPSTFL